MDGRLISLVESASATKSAQKTICGFRHRTNAFSTVQLIGSSQPRTKLQSARSLAPTGTSGFKTSKLVFPSAQHSGLLLKQMVLLSATSLVLVLMSGGNKEALVCHHVLLGLSKSVRTQLRHASVQLARGLESLQSIVSLENFSLRNIDNNYDN